MNKHPRTVTVNGRRYAFPQAPVVVVCIDGSEPDYMVAAMAAGRMPWLASVLPEGADLRADCVVPSFTNPNNLSIVTGQPPAVHGICGNFFYDPAKGAERSEEHTSELQSLMRISYAVFCLKKKKTKTTKETTESTH